MDIVISREPEALSVPEGVEEAVRAAAEKVGAIYGLASAEVSVTLTDDGAIRELNRAYRGIDRATDVLSFALEESEEPPVAGGPETRTLGDLVLSVERVAAQAAEYGHSLRREAAFLTAHGMLHLLGFDHMEEAEREEMERAQRVVMQALRIPREEDGNG